MKPYKHSRDIPEDIQRLKSALLQEAYDAGYDAFNNGGSLDYEPLNTDGDRMYRAGFEAAAHSRFGFVR